VSSSQRAACERDAGTCAASSGTYAAGAKKSSATSASRANPASARAEEQERDRHGDQRVGADHEVALLRQRVERELERSALAPAHPKASGRSADGREQAREDRLTPPRGLELWRGRHEQHDGGDDADDCAAPLPSGAGLSVSDACREPRRREQRHVRRRERPAPRRDLRHRAQTGGQTDDDADEQRRLQDHEQRLRAPAQQRLDDEQRGGDRQRLSEAERDQREPRVEPVDRRCEHRRGHERARAQHRQRDHQVQRPREMDLSRTHRQRADPIGGFVGAQQVRELAEQRHGDQRGAQRERDERVREARRAVADEPTQRRGNHRLHEQRSDRHEHARSLRREPRAQQDHDSSEHGG
jgi:hypothetical protein